MIIGIGIDLVETERMAKIYERFGARFLDHILAQGERESMPAKIIAPWLASRFAAKEAAVKALGSGFARGIIPQQIEVLRTPSGKPELKLHGQALRRAQLLGAGSWHVSLSHERQHALAMVILED